MTADPDEFLRPLDVERRYNISRSTLATWRHQGVGPSWQRLGPRRVVYRRSVLDAWVESQAQERAS